MTVDLLDLKYIYYKRDLKLSMMVAPIWSVSKAFLHQGGPGRRGGRSPAGFLFLSSWDYITKLYSISQISDITADENSFFRGGSDIPAEIITF